jgi:hypothetical protein
MDEKKVRILIGRNERKVGLWEPMPIPINSIFPVKRVGLTSI